MRSLKHTVVNIDVLFCALFPVWYSGINGRWIGMYLNLEHSLIVNWYTKKIQLACVPCVKMI